VPVRPFFGIPLKRFLFGREEIPGAEQAASPGLPPPQDLGALEAGAPPEIPTPQNVGAVEGLQSSSQMQGPQEAGALEGEPQVPIAAKPPIIPPSVRPALTSPQLAQGLPVPPTFEPLPRFQGPKGLRQILMYAIPGYAEGRQAGFQERREAAKYANLLKQQTYSEQMAAAREARMQEMGFGSLQQRIENFQETVRNHLAREELAKTANEQRKMAEFNKLMGRATFYAGYYADKDIPEEQKEAEIRKALGLGTTQQLNYQTLLGMAGGDPTLIETLPDEVKKMFGALPPQGLQGIQPSTRYGWVGPDLQGKYNWGIVGQTVPGLPAGTAQPPITTPPPAQTPFEPISLKAVPLGTVADPETERQIRSLAAQGGQDPEQLRQQLGYAPFAKAAAPTAQIPPVPAAPAKVHPSLFPTAATRQMSETAKVIVPKIDRLLADIQDPKLKAKLGPAIGRWNEFMAGKVGAGDPDFARMRTTLALITTGAMRAHVGARGSAGMLEHFKNLADASKMDEPTLTASLTAMRDFLSGYILTQPPSPNETGKTVTRLLLRKYAQSQNVTEQEAQRLFEAKGYKVID
jgi:uncharacterized membrane protein